MEIWKTRPGLEETLMRTINYNSWRNQEDIYALRTLHLKQRNDFWKLTDEARNAAARAIQYTFLSKKKKLENSYKRLHFAKIETIDFDLFFEIYQHI